RRYARPRPIPPRPPTSAATASTTTATAPSTSASRRRARSATTAASTPARAGSIRWSRWGRRGSTATRRRAPTPPRPPPARTGASCYANQAGGRLYDMSGNVAEWTSTQVVASGATYYKVRGGAYNNFSLGTNCNFDFTIEQPGYQFIDLGFRCCADHAP